MVKMIPQLGFSSFGISGAKTWYLILCLSFIPWQNSLAFTSDSLQKQFNHLKGADKISMLTSIADKELSGDPAFLKSAIKSILADPLLLKQKGSLDSLYKLVKVLSKY